MTGELWSQPPLGVHATMFPCLSATLTCTVSLSVTPVAWAPLPVQCSSCTACRPRAGLGRTGVGGAQRAWMRFARAVHRRPRRMALDRFGDEPRVESTQSSLDFDFAAACPGLLDKPPVGGGQVRVAKSHARAGHAVYEIDRRRRCPVVPKQWLDQPDHLLGPRKAPMDRARANEGEPQEH